MKALASEITRKLGKRLAWLNVIVKELTGKDQTLPSEIAASRLLCCFPILLFP